MNPQNHPLNTITNHSAIVYNQKRKAYRIKYKKLHTTNQVIILLDANYCQLLGFRNRSELFEQSGVLLDAMIQDLYHDPVTQKVYMIKPDSFKLLPDFTLYPLTPPDLPINL